MLRSIQERNNPNSSGWKDLLVIMGEYLNGFGYTPHIHYELEGTCVLSSGVKTLDFDKVNRFLQGQGIQARLKPEYWECQWEWESLFLGQSPVKVSDDLSYSLIHLPLILMACGAKEVSIKPVSWSAAKNRFAKGYQSIRSVDGAVVHIPNSIQISISASLEDGSNALLQREFGEVLQRNFMRTSRNCCLFYCPEEEAFNRLSLKKQYDLSNELSSPEDISGGTTGSVAFYKEIGKHGQLLGEKPLVYDQFGNPLVKEINWERFSRIEHRLGSSSIYYNPYLCSLYALANMSDAIDIVNGIEREGDCQTIETKLPDSLYSDGGAIDLFLKDTWFINRLRKDISGYLTSNLFELLVGNLVESLAFSKFR